ncbi:MAG: ABC transporter [Crocinitomicaceae bacterium]|nr:ABC transporter [Crocinitomicaceae bacterium]|tara:strand:+ start:12883 stop:14760 length:1878 start_codon:yes stop_codon:yes gene_type:complete
MNYLSVENISKRYGERVLFEGLSFGLDKGQKSALIARNGTGKTTLMNILAGLDTPDTGEVTYRNEIKVSFLPQEPHFDPQQRVGDALFHSEAPAVKAIREYEEAIESNDTDRMQKAIDKMDQLAAWDFEVQIKQILTKLKIHHFDQTISTLSGGQKRRLALAGVLIEEPDLLILDEPTNHLDLDMIEWLEEYLRTGNLTLLMVTHDRYFLENVCDDILEIDNGNLYRYKGNYSYYLEKKEEREQNLNSEISKAKNLMRKELEWMRRQPKARGTKSKARIDAFHDLKGTASQKVKKDELSLNVNMTRLGGKILELHSIVKQYGDFKIVDGFSYKFVKGEKIGIIGPNGVGKSTFLNMVMDLEQPDGGTIKTGETVVFGYYAQQGLNFKPGKRVIEVVKDIAEFIPLAKGKTYSAAQMLERFLFPRSQHYVVVDKLSGGEKRRLYLLTILMKNPNFLILDEPTNDLDVLTLTVLEDFLQEFDGCVLIVTHDRFFMDRLVDHVFVFEGEGVIRDFPGNYTQYRLKKAAEDAEEKARKAEEKTTKEEAKPVEQKAPAEKKKLSYKEKREFEMLSGEIEKLETEKAELTAQLNSGTLDHEALQKAGERIQEVIDLLDEKELRWLELSELA